MLSREISVSLTTISGLASLTLMHFRLGYDMGIVLIKAIVMSMLSVFLLMPGLLVLFSKSVSLYQPSGTESWAVLS